jgi:Gluconate 2-dehydrogenase subunit 3
LTQPEIENTMNRRDAIQRAALLMGSTFSLPALADTLENFEFSGLSAFTPPQVATLAELAETIIPRTKTPGAKDAKVQDFMVAVVSDCFKPEDRDKFMAGLADVDSRSQAAFKKNFAKCSPAQRTEVLKKLEADAMEHRKSGKGEHFWFTLKGLTLTGYFTSEPGATKALRYVAVPGRYEGCVPYKKGDKAWAT